MKKERMVQIGALTVALLAGIGLSWWALTQWFPAPMDKLIDLTHPYTYRFQTPWMKQEAQVVYPAGARRRSMEGSVILSMMVAADGKVSESQVLQSSGHSILDDAALDASHKLVIDIDKLGASAFPFEKKLKLTFRLEEAE